MRNFRFSLSAGCCLLFVGLACLPLAGCGGDEAETPSGSTDSASSGGETDANMADAGHGAPAPAMGGSFPAPPAENEFAANPGAGRQGGGSAPMAPMEEEFGEMGMSGGASSGHDMESPASAESSMMMVEEAGMSGGSRPMGKAGMTAPNVSGGGYPGGSYPGGSYPGAEGQGYGGYPTGSQQGGRPMAGPSRPADFSQWKNKDYLDAVKQQDGRVVEAIYAKSETAAGDPQFVSLMTDVLGELSGEGSSGGMDEGMELPFGIMAAPAGAGTGGGEPGFPPGLSPSERRNSGGRLVPPGGARMDGTRTMLKNSSTLPLDSIDVMLGEALLGFTPQAAQGVRGATGRLPGGKGGPPPGGGGIAEPGMSGTESLQGQEETPGMGFSSPRPGMGPPAMGGEPGMDEYEPPGSGNYGQGAQGYGGNQGYGGVQSGPGGAPAAGFSKLELVRAVVRGLAKNDSAEAWQTLHGIVKGDIATSFPEESNLRLVVEEAFSVDTNNAEMMQQLLAAIVEKTFGDPVTNAPSLVALGGLSQAPVDFYMKLGNGASGGTAMPAFTPQQGGQGMGGPAMNNPGMGGLSGTEEGLPGTPGMMESPGGGGGMSSPRPGMAGPPGGSEYGSGGPNMGQGRPGMAGPPGMEESNPGGYMGGPDAGNNLYNGGQPAQPIRVASGKIGETTFSRVSVSAAAMPTAAMALWSPASADLLSAMLDNAADVGSAGEALALATNVPSDTIRHSVYKLFSRSYNQGAESLLSSGITSSIGHDPALLCVLKSLPRVRPASDSASTTVDPLAKVKQSWVDATHSNVMALRDRLRSVEGNSELAYTGVAKFRLHRGAIPEASIAIVTASDLQDLLGSSAPSETKIYYARCQVAPERPAQMQEIVDHYVKTSKGYRRDYRAEGLLWCDGLRKEDGKLLSLDVIISQSGASQFGGNQGRGGMAMSSEGGFGPGGGGGGLGQFTIETIVVVASDPTMKPTEATLTTAGN